MPKIALKDRTYIKIELIHAVISGQVTSFSVASIDEGMPRRISIELEFDPAIMKTLAKHANRMAARISKRK